MYFSIFYITIDWNHSKEGFHGSSEKKTKVGEKAPDAYAQGNGEKARKYLTDALEIFERLGALIEPDKVRKELAELPQ